jgi:hypothetical protein
VGPTPASNRGLSTICVLKPRLAAVMLIAGLKMEARRIALLSAELS